MLDPVVLLPATVLRAVLEREDVTRCCVRAAGAAVRCCVRAAGVAARCCVRAAGASTAVRLALRALVAVAVLLRTADASAKRVGRALLRVAGSMDGL